MFAVMLLIATMVSSRAQSATPGYSITMDPLAYSPDYMFGYEFTPTNSFDVTALGFWDGGNDGLADSHQVAIYFATNYSTFVAGDQVPGALTTVLPTDSGAGLDIGTPTNGFYAYHSLAAPVRLEPGVVYRIAANGSSATDLQSYEPIANHTTLAPMITGPGVYRPIGESGLNVAYPTGVDNTYFYSTPNFLFTAVPEPQMVAMLAFGGLIVFTAARRAQGRRTTLGKDLTR